MFILWNSFVFVVHDKKGRGGRRRRWLGLPINPSTARFPRRARHQAVVLSLSSGPGAAGASFPNAAVPASRVIPALGTASLRSLLTDDMPARFPPKRSASRCGSP